MRHLLELFLFFTAMMVLTDWYIYRRYVQHWHKQWTRCLYILPTFVLFIAMTTVFSTFEPEVESMNRMGVFLVLFLCVNVPKAIFTLIVMGLKSIGKRIKTTLYETYVAMPIALLLMAYLIYGATEGKQHFQIIERTIQNKSIPDAFNGFRIVQIADIHAGSWGDNTEPLKKAVDLINELHPDLIVFTGDLVNNLASELNVFIPILSQLKAKHGVYSVLGNHDYSNYIRWESLEKQAENMQSLKDKQMQMGWELLNNSNVKLYLDTDSIALIGVENSGQPPFPDYANLEKAQKGTEGMFKILLSHDPSHWRREVLSKTDIQLTLSGHTHDMQTRIFGFSPAAFIYPEHSGVYTEGNQTLHVNIGLGHLLYPMRLGAWPEITLLTLQNQ